MKIVKLPNDFYVVLQHRCRILDFFLPKNYLFAWDSFILVPKKLPLESIKTNTLMRENVYLLQQRKYGKINWLFKFIFNKYFRRNQFFAAYVVQLKYTNSTKEREAVLREAAKTFSTKGLLYCGKYEELYKELLSRYDYAKLHSISNKN